MSTSRWIERTNTLMANLRHGDTMTTIVEKLRGWCVDWNGAPMVGGEPPRDGLRCDDLLDAIAEIEQLHEIIERYRAAVSRESADDLFGGEELAAANKLGDDICNYIERCRTGLQLDGAIRAGVDNIIRNDALAWLSQRPKIIAQAAAKTTST